MFRNRVELEKTLNREKKKSRREDAYRQIEEYLSTADLGSVKFLAFSDTIERQSILRDIDRLSGNRYITQRNLVNLDLKSTLIDETIRTRTDTLLGYYRQSIVIENLFGNAVVAEYQILADTEGRENITTSVDAKGKVLSKMELYRQDILIGDFRPQKKP